ncbi:MAG TPA: phage holin family protein [Thermodesulfobacteriota bacterium]|nr:phage holin family protein [Thermodesulfobacteriota bacterium]HNU70548.1 phage holin family protein [Thermodesulfobacteriota bacterium]HQO77630.1 phage holin family protein [Thermodesulfobacteriota bacterium]
MTNKEDHPLKLLFTQFTQELSSLMRQEVQLAKTEVSEKASQAGTGIAWIALGGALAYAGVIFLHIAAVIALSYLVPSWLAAIIVGAFAIIVGLGILQKGRSNLKAQNLVPHETVDSLRQDKNLAKDYVRRSV